MDVGIGARHHAVDIGGSESKFFSGQHGVEGPFDDIEPVVVTLTDCRSQRFLGDDFREDDIIVGVGKLDAQGIQLGLIAGQNVAAACLQTLCSLVGGIENDGFECHLVLFEIAGQVHLGGRAGLNTDGGAVQLGCIFNPELLGNQKSLAVIVGHTGEVETE